MKLYISQKVITHRSKQSLIYDLKNYVQKTICIQCKALKNRKLFLDKLPDIILERKNAKHRLECFSIAIEILKKSTYIKQNILNNTEYEVFGLDRNKNMIKVHIREEIHLKNKKLFFISCFWTKEKASSP